MNDFRIDCQEYDGSKRKYQSNCSFNYWGIPGQARNDGSDEEAIA